MSENDCRHPCGCDQFPEDHCACMDGHAAPTPAPRADVDELGRLLAAATPGPWRYLCSTGDRVVTYCDPDVLVSLCVESGDDSAPHVAAFATAMMSAAPALLAEVSELRATVARVERGVGMQGYRFCSRECHGEALAIVRAALGGAL